MNIYDKVRHLESEVRVLKAEVKMEKEINEKLTVENERLKNELAASRKVR